MSLSEILHKNTNVLIGLLQNLERQCKKGAIRPKSLSKMIKWANSETNSRLYVHQWIPRTPRTFSAIFGQFWPNFSQILVKFGHFLVNFQYFGLFQPFSTYLLWGFLHAYVRIILILFVNILSIHVVKIAKKRPKYWKLTWKWPNFTKIWIEVKWKNDELIHDDFSTIYLNRTYLHSTILWY